MRTIFFSDVHLHDCESPKARHVLQFFDEVVNGFERVFILGDLFDSWPATSPYLVKRFDPFLSRLKAMTERGVEVHYFEGNHDFHLGKYFSEELGVRVHTDHHEVEIGSFRAFIAHGDLGNPNETGYRLLRKVLRSRPLHWAMRTIPHSIVFGAGRVASQLSRKFTSPRQIDLSAIRDLYRSESKKYFEKGYDIVMMGHTHIPDNFVHNVNGRECRYINTGDWLSNYTYVEFDGSQFYTREHPVKTNPDATNALSH